MAIRFMFDVESTSLHGEGFGFGYVVLSEEGCLIGYSEWYSLEGAAKAGEWVKENVLPHLPLGDPKVTVATDRELRNRFFTAYKRWKDAGAEIWGDVIWPVEANFMSAVIADGEGSRDWDGPYPLRDAVDVVERAFGKDVDRVLVSGLDGLRKHNPLDDAKASAFALLKAERKLGLKT